MTSTVARGRRSHITNTPTVVGLWWWSFELLRRCQFLFVLQLPVLLLLSTVTVSSSSSSSFATVGSGNVQQGRLHTQQRVPNNKNEELMKQIHQVGHNAPWIPGPHPHHIYNSTTRTWSSIRKQQNQNQKRSLHTNTDGTSSSPPQTIVRQYQLWTAEEIAETMKKWSKHYPSSIVQITTAQELYQLPTAGGIDDCPYETKQSGCLNYIILIQDTMAHPTTTTTTTPETQQQPSDGGTSSTSSSSSSKRLPDVLWSGELHGNERVGPTAVLEATQLLLDAVICESLPRTNIDRMIDDEEYDMELQRAHDCRHDLYERGINDEHRQWLARLVTTRRLVVVPTANALGYYQNTREENQIDPNRDFPYDQTNPTACMQTIAGRTLNELFRRHLFQLSLTFHGGMEVIGYEWGAPSHNQQKSPDDVAQHTIAKAYSQYAGKFTNTPVYDFGPMNDLVYPVNGGMEDWAYAGSWDPDLVIECAPITYNGYPKSQTRYDNSTLRVFNMLVETSNHKTPDESELGTSLDILSTSFTGNGHVARNIRLALLAVELVQPYVIIQSVNGVSLSDDIVPLIARGGTGCQTTKAMAVPDDTPTITVQWVVGGALMVDTTTVLYTKWDTNIESMLDCDEQPDLRKLQPFLSTAKMTSASTGNTRFSAESNFEATVFSATLDTSHYRVGDRIVVIATARVDQDWGTADDLVSDRKIGPLLGPQSHVVNARTNPNWYHSSADGSKVVQGRLDWVSIPLTIVIKDYSSTVPVPAEELSLRYNESQIADDHHHDDDDDHNHDDSSSVPGGDDNNAMTSGSSSSQQQGRRRMYPLLFLSLLTIIVVVGFVGFGRQQQSMRYTHRERVKVYIDDETAITPGLQTVFANTKNGHGSITTPVAQRFSDTVDTNGHVDEADRVHGVELGTYT